MFVDPAVSRAKVDRELNEYLALQDLYRKRGIWLLEYKFPQLLFALVAVNAKPTPMVPLGVLLDFTDYDMAPPSVTLVNPLTKESLKRSEIKCPFLRQRPDGQVDQLVQAFADDRPFLCLQGVREYHDNPAHTGDSWYLHRQSGKGKLVYLLDILSRYGVEPIQGHSGHMQFVPTGFAISALPS